MYYLNHYVIVWENVKSLDDLKRILQATQITLEPNYDISSIKDLVRLEPKPPLDIKFSMLDGT